MVFKYLLVGLIPLVSCTPNPKTRPRDNFKPLFRNYGASHVIDSVLDNLGSDDQEYCLFFDFDKTISKQYLTDIVRDKQIEKGLYGFGPDMVQDVFGFQNVPPSLDCFFPTVEFREKVAEIYDFFVKHQPELKFKPDTWSSEKQNELRKLIDDWGELVFKSITYEGDAHERCFYLLLTKDYRLLFGLKENIRNKLIADAFDVPGSSHLSPEHLIAKKQKQFAYPKMLEFINVLRQKNAKSFIISATHYEYLDPTLKALGIEDQFTGVRGSSATGDLWENVLAGNGYSMSAERKADAVTKIINDEQCCGLFAVGDSKYDYEMLQVIIEVQEKYGLVISHAPLQPPPKVMPEIKELEYFPFKYRTRVATQHVDGDDWVQGSLLPISEA